MTCSPEPYTSQGPISSVMDSSAGSGQSGPIIALSTRWQTFPYRLPEIHLYTRECDCHAPSNGMALLSPVVDRIWETGYHWFTIELEDRSEALMPRPFC
jgi:hypothetical protein